MIKIENKVDQNLVSSSCDFFFFQFLLITWSFFGSGRGLNPDFAYFMHCPNQLS